MNTVQINDIQKTLYGKYEENSVERYMEYFSKLIEILRERDSINILDIGGATGEFAAELYKRLDSTSNIKIYVIDGVAYDSWSQPKSGIEFIKADAFTIDKLFEQCTFDCIFANRVFHHLITGTWSKTISNMNLLFSRIHTLLRDDGFFAITDHYYDGFFYDKITSFLLFTFTTNKSAFASKLFFKLGAKSSGVGVCMLSKKCG